MNLISIPLFGYLWKVFPVCSGITVDFSISPGLARMTPELEIALFRAIQEGLTNVHRYAKASAVEIVLTAENGHILLEICDNARSIPRERLASSAGKRVRCSSWSGWNM